MATMLVMMAAKYTKAERVPKAVERKWKKVNINREQVHRIDEQLPQHYRNGGKLHGLQALPPSPFISLGHQHKAENQGAQQGLV